MNEKKLSELISRSVINVDKPTGMTSNDVVITIKKMFNLKRCGHTGTLDPRVTGVLIVALENATKAMPVLMRLDKEYEGILYLHKDVNRTKLEKVISEHFIGEITQIPPVKSHVARKARKRKVYYFNILEKNEKNVKFRTKVESGTYIRKLCSDIGEKIGVKAHMKELRRTAVGHFKIAQSHPLDKIKNAYNSCKEGNETSLKNILIPIEKAIPHVKKVYVKDLSVSSVRHGDPIKSSDIFKLGKNIKSDEIVSIFSPKNKLIAIGKKTKFVIKIERVF